MDDRTRELYRTAEILLGIAVLLLLVIRALPEPERGPVPPPSELLLRIDLNRAPWHELIHLPGIGEVRAREIERDRAANGPFRRPEDLIRVHGIGPATVEGVREHLFGSGD